MSAAPEVFFERHRNPRMGPMYFHKWLDQVRQRVQSNAGKTAAQRRRPATTPNQPTELLEARAVLSVSTLFVAGELSIIIDGADSVVVRPNPADTNPQDGAPLQVLQNGVAATTVSSVQVQNIQSIKIRGGGSANLIDLSAVQADTFTSLVSIRVEGGDGNDTILGSADLNDTIIGSDGDDSIVGGSGNNTIDAGDGNDTIEANAGVDTVDAGDGNDLVTAGDGSDNVRAGDGNDIVSGEDGDDTIDAGDGADLINGNAGNDSVSGDFGPDTLNGDAGDDFVIGGEGRDSVSGGDDNDTLYGLAGNDTISGDDGDDQLYGGTLHDILNGGGGADLINGGIANDTADGGDGSDFIFGGGGNDSLTGGLGGDTVYGNAGNDSLQGSDGQDLLRGGADDDVILSTDVAVTPPPSQLARLFAIAIDNTNSIVELDPVTGNEIRRFPAPEAISSGGDGLAFDGNHLFFMNGFGTDMMYEIDPDSGTVVDQDPITIGSRNYEGLAVLGGLVYFLDVSAGDIHVYDPSTDTVIDTLDINGTNPTVSLLQGGLAGIGNPDQLVVVEAGGNRVLYVSAATGQVVSAFTPNTPSAGAYFGAGALNGEVYLGSSTSGTIDVFSRSGILQRSVPVPYPVSAIGADDIGTSTVPPGSNPISTFDIDLVFDSSITNAQQAIFRQAADRWEQIIVGDLPDVIVPGIGQVDDISIDISAITIDTVGNILANTQLIAARAGSFLPSAADIQVDSLDINALQTSGQLLTVALHEIAHCLGFGTVWSDLGLISGLGGQDPQFRGPNAIAEYNARFGGNALGVPVENTGGPGTTGTHWRETTLTNELMTSVTNPGANPLTRLTVAQFQDLGYQVDYSQADAIDLTNFSSVDLRTGGNLRTPYGFQGIFLPVGSGGSDSAGSVGYGAAKENVTQFVSGTTTVGSLKPMIVFPGLSASKAQTPSYGPTAVNLQQLADLQQINARLQVPEVEGNDSIATAMNVDASFSQEFDPNIGSTAANTSTTLPHASIQGTGDGTYDFYAFTVTNAGDRGIFDMDFTSGPGGFTYDTVFVVYDSLGQVVAFDDDSSTSDGQGGSTSNFDSFLDIVFTNPGTYYIGIGEFDGFSNQGSVVPSGAIYTLQISIQNHQLAGTPTTPNTPTNGDTVFGDDGNDTMFGSPGDDLLTGGFGNDVINGDAGNDMVYGGAGGDVIDAGDGDDFIRGNAGNDTINNGAGDDAIQWRIGDNNDLVLDADGADTVDIWGGNLNDVFTVGQNADRLVVSRSGETVTVESGSTTVNVNGFGGNDTFNVGDLDTLTGLAINLLGGAGTDTFNAAGSVIGSVRLTMDGGEGGDAINGTNENETIIGGDGNDTINGGGGQDTIFGSAGNDILSGGFGDDVLDGGTGLDTLLGGAGNDSLNGGTNHDSLLGGDGNDTLSGDSGDDTAFGEAGNDSILGVAGNDALNGGIGDDVISGGTENDVIFGLDGADSILGGDGEDRIDAGAGNDVVDAGDGDDSVDGNLGNDTLDGGDGNDTVAGGFGNDFIFGGDGNDTLLGQADDDTVLGGDGDDAINGNGGQDTLAGNEGFDTIKNTDNDRIDENFVLPDSIKALLAGLGK